MATKVNQNDINMAAWSACDSFRGAVDPAQYKDYILVLLFLKYVSDIWKRHYEGYLAQYGDEEDKKTKKRTVIDRFLASYYSCMIADPRPTKASSSISSWNISRKRINRSSGESFATSTSTRRLT